MVMLPDSTETNLNLLGFPPQKIRSGCAASARGNSNFEPQRVSPGLGVAQFENNTICFGTDKALETGSSCNTSGPQRHVVNTAIQMNEVVRALPYGVSSGKSAVSRQPDGNLLAETIHVLLVDDERLSRLVVGNLLKKCKYKGGFRPKAGNPSNVERVCNVLMIPAVTAVSTGMEALEALRMNGAGTFQLVLTVSKPRYSPREKGVICLFRIAAQQFQHGQLIAGCHDARCGRN